MACFYMYGWSYREIPIGCHIQVSDFSLFLFQEHIPININTNEDTNYSQYSYGYRNKAGLRATSKHLPSST